MRKLVLAASLAALAAPALAEQAPPPIELSPRREAPPPERRGPGRIFISPSGEPFRGADGLAAWFAEADADHDGALSPAEFQADAARAFQLYDANRDGVIDGFEVQAYERERVPEIAEISVPGEGGPGGWRGRRGGRRGRDAGGPHGGAGFPTGGREGAARFSLLSEPEPLLAADTDVDGRITVAEWTGASARRFARLDQAHAGQLTLEGLRGPPAKGKRPPPSKTAER